MPILNQQRGFIARHAVQCRNKKGQHVGVAAVATGRTLQDLGGCCWVTLDFVVRGAHTLSPLTILYVALPSAHCLHGRHYWQDVEVCAYAGGSGRHPTDLAATLTCCCEQRMSVLDAEWRHLFGSW